MVFEIQVVQVFSSAQVHGVAHGTGFFVSPDGTAITNSHVVNMAVTQPGQYRLVALIPSALGLELYDIAVQCASPLMYETAQMDTDMPVHRRRDVALIRVIPSTLAGTSWNWSTDGGTLRAVVHNGPLSLFPFLSVAGRAAAGTRVWAIGFGPTASPLAPEITSGSVVRTLRMPDGTTVFMIGLGGPPEHGFSGSPVIDEQREVVGLWTWASSGTIGVAQSNEVLTRPCQ